MISAYVRIWLWASTLFAILTGIVLAMLPHHSSYVIDIFCILILLIVCSFLYSIPFILAAAVLAAIVIACKTRLGLFGIILSVNVFISLCTAILFVASKGPIDKEMIGLCIAFIAAAIGPVFICKKHLDEIVMIEE